MRLSRRDVKSQNGTDRRSLGPIIPWAANSEVKEVWECASEFRYFDADCQILGYHVGVAVR